MRHAALLFALLAAGCTAPPRDQLAWISLGGSGPCTVDIGKRRFTLPADEGALSSESRRVAGTRAGALVAASPQGLSFDCYRTAMAVIDRAGFRRMGFVSDFVPDE
jgi:hypothetical protein